MNGNDRMKFTDEPLVSFPVNTTWLLPIEVCTHIQCQLKCFKSDTNASALIRRCQMLELMVEVVLIWPWRQKGPATELPLQVSECLTQQSSMSVYTGVCNPSHGGLLWVQIFRMTLSQPIMKLLSAVG